MFNNIIYFFIVLIIYSIHFPSSAEEANLLHDVAMGFVTWVIFAGYCRFGFHRLIHQSGWDQDSSSALGMEYQRLVARLSILAVFLFTLDVYVFNLKYWLQLIPGIKRITVIHGILAITVFFFYLSTIWHYAHQTYKAAFQTRIGRRPFIVSNLKLNLPILFPWIILNFIYDLISIGPFKGLEMMINEPVGQGIFFVSFLIVLMIFLPRLVQYWWNCRPFEPSQRIQALETFLESQGFKYRDILNWPIFEGRMMTAGIMGIVPRYRYILITESLMDALDLEELKSVISHEMGHAKHRHMLLYIVFFAGYFILSFGLFDIFTYMIASHPIFIKLFQSGESRSTDLFYLVLSIPILITMFVYFRYVMGFFMRHFERQADLHSAVTMGGPKETISSLEKIALLSGKIRDIPSWHHFSIRQRVEYLRRMVDEPAIVRKHHRFISATLGIYLLCIAGLGYVLNFSPLKRDLTDHFIEAMINEQLVHEPNNVLLYQRLAELYHRDGKYYAAIDAYEKILSIKPDQPTALNNFAWLLVTAPNPELRNEKRALILAERAVELNRSPVFLDTLAEAYYANGLYSEAVKTIEEAIELAPKDGAYYKKQLKKFREKLG